MLEENHDIGMIGLGVMGSSLARNMASKGFSVSCYDWDEKLRTRFARNFQDKNLYHAPDLAAFISSLIHPRKIMLMIKAGAPVDSVMDQLIPLLAKGDVIIDGGNSQFADTDRRVARAADAGIHFIGCGVSGGEEGALKGPSMMPGGSPEAWPLVQPVFESICAKTQRGDACCAWIGEGGAGHFVKMVHNGIEYGDMQLICEVYQFMRDALGMSNGEMADVFKEWNRGELDSFLIAITGDILAFHDADGAQPVDYILDAAGQKGTGKWTLEAALDAGEPLPLIGEAVFARALSALKETRMRASQVLNGPDMRFEGDRAVCVDQLRKALYASKIISYAQGLQLIMLEAKDKGWHIAPGDIARVWQGGCIIRSVFLSRIRESFEQNPDLENLLLAPFFKEEIHRDQSAWRSVVAQSAQLGIPMPAISSALAYYDGFRCARGSANLLQAQRDFFGAHTYERIDRPRGEFFHTRWGD
jgi:6-phosphogluconate dehydrogenase